MTKATGVAGAILTTVVLLAVTGALARPYFQSVGGVVSALQNPDPAVDCAWVTHPLPNVESTAAGRRIFGLDAEHVYATTSGANSALVPSYLEKWDGGAWGVEHTFTANSADSVWATSPNDVWLAGSSNLGNPSQWYQHFDGTGWTAFTNPSSTSLNPHGLRGTAPNDIWSVNMGGVQGEEIQHYDGTAWGHVATGFSAWTPRAIMPFAANDVWIAGNTGSGSGTAERLIHWDGATWTQITVPASTIGPSRLSGIWGTSSNNLWLTAEQATGGPQRGTMFHYDGTSVTQVFTSTFQQHRVWGSSADNVYSVSDREIWHYDGSSWSVAVSFLSTDTAYSYTYNLQDVSVLDAQHVYAINNRGFSLHYECIPTANASLLADVGGVLGIAVAVGAVVAFGAFIVTRLTNRAQ